MWWRLHKNMCGQIKAENEKKEEGKCGLPSLLSLQFELLVPHPYTAKIFPASHAIKLPRVFNENSIEASPLLM